MAKKKQQPIPSGKKKPAAKAPQKPAQAQPQAKPAAPGSRKVLHVGCGPHNPEKLPKVFRTEEWKEVRLDIDENVKPDIIASMTDMHMVEDGAMDGLFSSHNVEHLYRHQVPDALKEFHRVIKPGGMVMITLPDIQSVAAYVAEGALEEPLYQSPAGPIAPVDILYGWSKSIAEGNHFMAHKTGFTAKSLAKQLLQAGFSNVTVKREWLDLWAVGYKLPEDHPQRSARAKVGTTRMHGPKGQQYPLWYARQLQMQENPQVKTDRLDTEPRMWKPLGLK